MNYFSPLPLGEKIMQIRKAKGFSMENMACAIKKSQAFISRLEHGDAECNSDMLSAIRKFLGIGDAPLLEDELRLYRDCIIVCHDLLCNGRLDEAKVILDELAVIVHLPFECSMYVMYLMSEAKWHIRVGSLGNQCKNIPKAEKLLAKAEAVLDSISNEALYMYHYLKGYVYLMYNDNAKALMHFMKARDMECELQRDFDFYRIVGTVYYNAGKLSRALLYYELAKSNYQGGNTDLRWSRLNLMLGVCYLCMGDYRRARKLLDANVTQSKSINDEHGTASALIQLGIICQRTKEYKESMTFFDQAMFLEFPPSQVSCLSLKADSLRCMKEFDKAHEVLEQGRAIAKGDEKLTIELDTIGHLMSLDNMDSVSYIEEVAIPNYRAGTINDQSYAIQLCNELEIYHKKKRTKTKAWAVAALTRDIYEEMIVGDVEY